MTAESIRPLNPSRPAIPNTGPVLRVVDDAARQEVFYRPGPYARMVKPLLDRLAGLLFTILSAPALLVVLVVVLVTLGRPLLFRQRRVGKDGEIFTIYKVRTMHPDRRERPFTYDGSDRRLTHKSEADPRLIPVSRVLRKLSLDELPQFWNVLAGQMSIVGPRPEMADIVAEKYEPWQHQRHQVKPGITGLWQIQLRDQGRLMYKDTEVDLEYLRHQSFFADLKILLGTPAAILGLRQGRHRDLLEEQAAVSEAQG